MEFIKETHRKADIVKPSPKGAARPPTRTLWHALYVPEERKVQVSFYLHDEPAGAETRVVRSEYLEFGLTAAKTKG